MEQAELLAQVIEVLESRGIAYMLVGSLASGVYGEPRLTHDIDIVIQAQSPEIDELCSAFPAPEYYVSREAARQAAATHGQFNVIHPASGNKIDFIVNRDDAWGRSQIGRRRREQILPGRPGYAAAPEDVVLGKLWYYREGGSEKHLRDVAAVVQVSGRELDMDYIRHWTTQLDLDDIWQMVLNKLESQ